MRTPLRMISLSPSLFLFSVSVSLCLCLALSLSLPPPPLSRPSFFYSLSLSLSLVSRLPSLSSSLSQRQCYTIVTLTCDQYQWTGVHIRHRWTGVHPLGLSAAGVAKYGAGAEIEARLASYLAHPKVVAVGMAQLDFAAANTDDEKRAQVDGVQMLASDLQPATSTCTCNIHRHLHHPPAPATSTGTCNIHRHLQHPPAPAPSTCTCNLHLLKLLNTLGVPQKRRRICRTWMQC